MAPTNPSWVNPLVPLALLSVPSPVEDETGDKGGFGMRSRCVTAGIAAVTHLGQGWGLGKAQGDLVAQWGWHQWWPG